MLSCVRSSAIQSCVVLDESLNLSVSGQKAMWATMLAGQVALFPIWEVGQGAPDAPLGTALVGRTGLGRGGRELMCCSLPTMQMPQSSPARESDLEHPAAPGAGSKVWGRGGDPQDFARTHT